MTSKRICITFLTVLLFISAISLTASAQSYTYDYWQNAIPSPDGYAPSSEISAESLGIPSMTPVDMTSDDEGNIYILDDGLKRVIILNPDLTLKKVIDTLTSSNGTVIKGTKKFSGICFYNESIYIADSEMGQILRIDKNGVVLDYISLPQTSLIPEGYVFKPQKIMIDSKGILYILCADLYQGAVMLNNKNEFMGFYGTNRVEMSPKLLIDYFWKSISDPSQKKKISVYVPTEYVNFCKDSEDFVYTVTGVSGNGDNLIRKFNPKGNDVFLKYPTKFGDWRAVYDKNTMVKTSFNAITVSESGLIAAVDKTRGRIFEYDRETNLLFAFGDTGDKKGHFENPVAVRYAGKKLLALDGTKGLLTVFEETEYGSLVHNAASLCEDGKYNEAKESLQLVLKQNANNETAYLGLGKAYMGLKNYKEAMQSFKLAQSRENYSKAFKEYRNSTAKSLFPYALCAVLIITVLVTVLRPKRKKSYVAQAADFPVYLYPFKIISRPIRVFQDLKLNGQGNALIAVIILALWLLGEILVRQSSGFLFNLNRPEDINILFLAAGTIGLFICFSVCNWAVGTLNDGSGKLMEIAVFAAYAITPYVIYRYAYLLFSNLLTIEESVLLDYVGIVIIIWTAVTILSAIMAVHDYTFGQSVGSFVITVLGVAAVLFILVLLYNLFMQFYDLIANIFTELRLR